MRNRRCGISDEKDNDQVLPRACAANVEKSPRPLDACFATVLQSLFVSRRKLFQSEVFLVGELKVRAFLVIEDDEHTIELGPFHALLRGKRRFVVNVSLVGSKLLSRTG